MKPKTCLTVVVFALSVLVSPTFNSPAARAGGLIMSADNVNIQQRTQRAVIAHDCMTEILILQNDLRADKETKVVQFVPLPSRPTVSPVPKGCLTTLQQMVQAHKLQYSMVSTDEGGEKVTEYGPVKVVVDEELIPQEVTITEVKEADDFTRRVKQFFQEKGLGEPVLDRKVRETAEDYVKRGFCFFVFDVVAVSPGEKTVQPLVYEFKTNDVYYPLKVLNPGGGRGTVELLTILPQPYGGRAHWISIYSAEAKRVTDEPSGTSQYWYIRSAPVDVKTGELQRFHAAIGKLLDKDGGSLRAHRYEGPLGFEADVQLPVGFIRPWEACYEFIRNLKKWDLQGLAPVLGVPFDLDGTKVVADKVELANLLRAYSANPPSDRVTRFCLPWNEAVKDLEEFEKRFGEQHLKCDDVWVLLATTPRKDKAARYIVRRAPQGRFEVVGFRMCPPPPPEPPPARLPQL